MIVIKLLIGGSPCTHWSIAQTKNRETEPSGIGWELFENYLIALEKFKPDFFLYENNKSMSKAIRTEITNRFGFEPICINSALVSAQNRQRLYWCGKRNQDGTYSKVDVQQPEDKGILLRDILETGEAFREKAYTLKAQYYKSSPACAVDTGHFPAPMVAESVEAYCLRYERTEEAKRLRKAYEAGEIKHGYHEYHELHPRLDGKTNTLTTVQKDNQIIEKVERYDLLEKPIYEVRNGLISINGKQYPIKLTDGFYIIRKLTVTECKRLQTVPDSYVFPVSNSQAYKMLGNGWTVDVIAHILSHCQGIASEELDVLSMYDGMACGHIALDKLRAHISRYRATEIDKYAIKTACHNFPDIEQLGDAFQVRNKDWI